MRIQPLSITLKHGLYVVSVSISANAVAADSLSDRIDLLERSIGLRCLENSFICDPFERPLKDELSQLRFERLLQAYGAVSVGVGVAPFSLMAVCETLRAEGIAKEVECAREWGTWLTEHEGSSLYDALVEAVGPVEADRIKIRQEELGWEYWPEQMLAAEAGSSDVESSEAAVVVHADADGHFRVSPELDGVEIDMMVDTGASAVFLTAADAERVGIKTDDLIYDVPVQTAAGELHVAQAIVRNLTLFGLHLRDQPVLVASQEEASTSLLGMSVLGEFTELSFRGSELHLRP